MPDQVDVQILDHPITASYVGIVRWISCGGGHAKPVPQNEPIFSTPQFLLFHTLFLDHDV